MGSACLARARHAESACLALPRRHASARARRSRSSLPAEWACLRSVPQRAAAAADGRRQRLQPLHVRGRLQRRQVRLRIRAERRLAAPGRPDRAPLRGPGGSAPRSPRRLSGAPPPPGALDARLLAAKGPLPFFSQGSAQICLDNGSACKDRKSGDQGLSPAPAAACFLQQPRQIGRHTWHPAMRLHARTPAGINSRGATSRARRAAEPAGAPPRRAPPRPPRRTGAARRRRCRRPRPARCAPRRPAARTRGLRMRLCGVCGVCGHAPATAPLSSAA